MKTLKTLALALLAGIALSASGPADAHQAGCYFGRTHAAWDVHRVYGSPHGCVWIHRPAGAAASIGPQIRTRLHGTEDSEPLARDPIGDATAVCGFNGFFVSWPYFVVTAKRVAWGAGRGCQTLGGTAAVVWSGHFVFRQREGRRPARWVPVVDATSPPLRRP
jgi:hypothetical protein